VKEDMRENNRKDIVGISAPALDYIPVDDSLLRLLKERSFFPETIKRSMFYTGVSPTPLKILYKPIDSNEAALSNLINLVYDDDDKQYLRVLICPLNLELDFTGLDENHRNLVIIQPTNTSESWDNTPLDTVSSYVKISPTKIFTLVHDLLLDISVANSHAFYDIVQLCIKDKGQSYLYTSKSEFAFEYIKHSNRHYHPKTKNLNIMLHLQLLIELEIFYLKKNY